jgi:hypothetical protein
MNSRQPIAIIASLLLAVLFFPFVLSAAQHIESQPVNQGFSENG